ncbi:MAG: methyltransferase [Candidatus Methanomethyliaceae archaeon]|nr:methyltransferase [Candidatus Methanomethyliaceae archaeon]MDW7970302.1 methyltransferase domain-containing protein [Nitrososphaerota archaeon]
MIEIKFYSEKTGKYYKLVNTSTWPYLEISGIKMHRADEIDPKKDAMLKIKALGRIYGRILDCCTGLGYTAIIATSKRNVEEVITIEIDENVIEIAKKNSFSKPLFENPKIKIIIGDAFQEIRNFEDEYFNFIIHDPPRISIAHELYSLEFYKQLFRVLRKNGRMFHYVGRPGMKQGKNYIKGIVNRLRLAGFSRIKMIDYALGLIAEKIYFRTDNPTI